jgi:hypothetical protein
VLPIRNVPSFARFVKDCLPYGQSAAQVVRQLMRKFIALHETPNTTTIEAMKSTDRGLGLSRLMIYSKT